MKLHFVGVIFGLVTVLSGCSSDDKELGQGTGGAAGGGSGGTAGSGGASGGTSGSGGAAGGGGAETGCTDSGGAVTNADCCQSAGDFPNTCLDGACGCSLQNSHSVKVCTCPSGTCFDGASCVGSGGTGGGGGTGGAGGAGGAGGSSGSGGSGGAAQACVDSGGTVITHSCCQATGDFPNECSVGACGCSPQNSHDVQACQCPTGKCFDGSTCK
ncbi:MAG: hypothetical protein U0263_13425 [Polyangiaceae bacterium]